MREDDKFKNKKPVQRASGVDLNPQKFKRLAPQLFRFIADKAPPKKELGRKSVNTVEVPEKSIEPEVKTTKYPRLEKFGLTSTMIIAVLFFWDMNTSEKIINKILVTPLILAFAVFYISSIAYASYKARPLLLMFFSQEITDSKIIPRIQAGILLISLLLFIFNVMNNWG
jgi:hypothetical protein